LGFSPDHADAAVIAVDVVRKVLNVLPEEMKGSQGVMMDDFEKLEKMAILAEEDGFEGKKHQISDRFGLQSVFDSIDDNDYDSEYFGDVGLI
jgi:predicted AAA+ superfamily ATPase